MNWITLSLLSMFAKSAQNFAEKESQNKLGSFLTMFLLITISTVLIIPYILLFDPLPSVSYTFWFGVIGSVIFYMLAKPLKLFALGRGDISEIVPLVSFSSLFKLILGWIFLNEIPTSWGLLGVSLIAVGGYLMNYEHLESNWISKMLNPFKKIYKSKPQFFLFVSLVLGPISSLFDKIAINDTFPRSPHYVLLSENLILITLLVPVLFVRKVKLDRLKKASSWKVPLILGLIFAVKTLLDFSAISVGNIGYVAAIKQLSSFAAIIGGCIFLGEKKLKKRLLSGIVMAIGTFLVGYLG